jgi:hypothetical protein
MQLGGEKHLFRLGRIRWALTPAAARGVRRAEAGRAPRPAAQRDQGPSARSTRTPDVDVGRRALADQVRRLLGRHDGGRRGHCKVLGVAAALRVAVWRARRRLAKIGCECMEYDVDVIAATIERGERWPGQQQTVGEHEAA